MLVKGTQWVSCGEEQADTLKAELGMNWSLIKRLSFHLGVKVKSKKKKNKSFAFRFVVPSL